MEDSVTYELVTKLSRTFLMYISFSLRKKMSRMDQCRPLLLSYGRQFHAPSCQFPFGTFMVDCPRHW